MKTPLATVAGVRIGSPFRERIVHEPRGKYLVVQGKDVGLDGDLILGGMVRIAEAPNKKADVLKAGEIVFQTRGVSYRAAVVPSTDAPLIAAGSLFILSPDPARIATEYLVFFLKSSDHPSGPPPDGDGLDHSQFAPFRGRTAGSAATQPDGSAAARENRRIGPQAIRYHRAHQSVALARASRAHP